jgi:acyl-CoA reductase-like NAD-dependent aldehyde dehydrogenase
MERLELPNFVGGAAVSAASGATRTIRNPASDEPIGEVPDCDATDVDRAVEAAEVAFAEWRDTTPAERSSALLALADLLDEHSEELARLESANVGKPISAAREENPVSSDNLRFFAAAARCLDGRPAGEFERGYTSMVRREPVGVVGQIAPWN